MVKEGLTKGRAASCEVLSYLAGFPVFDFSCEAGMRAQTPVKGDMMYSAGGKQLSESHDSGGPRHTQTR